MALRERALLGHIACNESSLKERQSESDFGSTTIRTKDKLGPDFEIRPELFH